MFADDTTPFTGTHDITTCPNELNNNLKKNSDWAQEVIFGGKLKDVSHPPLIFSNPNISSCKSQKHLDILLDSKLTFEEHTKHTNKDQQNHRTFK